MGVIVVGVDHSAGAKAALQFALEEARLRQATLRVVHAYQFGYIGAIGLEGAPTRCRRRAGGLSPGRRGRARRDPERSRRRKDGVAIERRVDQGSAAAVLVEESRGADLLVVGSRGHGGFAQLLLGSVSQQCAQHAFCPVVIVRGTAKNGNEESEVDGVRNDPPACRRRPGAGGARVAEAVRLLRRQRAGRVRERSSPDSASGPRLRWRSSLVSANSAEACSSPSAC